MNCYVYLFVDNTHFDLQDHMFLRQVSRIYTVEQVHCTTCADAQCYNLAECGTDFLYFGEFVTRHSGRRQEQQPGQYSQSWLVLLHHYRNGLFILPVMESGTDSESDS